MPGAPTMSVTAMRNHSHHDVSPARRPRPQEYRCLTRIAQTRPSSVRVNPTGDRPPRPSAPSAAASAAPSRGRRLDAFVTDASHHHSHPVPSHTATQSPPISSARPPSSPAAFGVRKSSSAPGHARPPDLLPTSWNWQACRQSGGGGRRCTRSCREVRRAAPRGCGRHSCCRTPSVAAD